MNGRATIDAPPTPRQSRVEADRVPRLLAGSDAPGSTVGLDQHWRRWGPLPRGIDSSFIDELDRSGLRGHGGAWFPVGTKWRSVRRSLTRRPVVVANGAEGEPASGKDLLLLTQRPHLVLDGATVAARTIGASRVILHVSAAAREPVARAVHERDRRGCETVPVEIVVAPDRFVAGQESAVVATINDRRPGLPTFTGVSPVRERGVDGRPTLVQNVETLAHVALIARFGAAWFRGVGTPESPGTALLTVTGRWSEPRILETPLGARLGDALGFPPHEVHRVQGVLLGGFGGGWMPTERALAMPLTEEVARAQGTSIGAGVVVLLPQGTCPLAEVSRVVTYLEAEGAGQCGPCVNGLSGLSRLMSLLASHPAALGDGLASIPVLCDLVEGRGACRHPDGVTRFVRTALQVFGEHAAAHLRHGPCAITGPPFLPLPSPHRLRRTTGMSR